MKHFIEDLYYGNIEPQCRSTKQNAVVVQAMETLSTNEALLGNELSDKTKTRFLAYANAWSIVNGESNLDSFITGFRLGAQCIFDAFLSSDAPFEELIK